MKARRADAPHRRDLSANSRSPARNRHPHQHRHTEVGQDGQVIGELNLTVHGRSSERLEMTLHHIDNRIRRNARLLPDYAAIARQPLNLVVKPGLNAAVLAYQRDAP